MILLPHLIMILLPHLILIFILLALTTYWRIEETILWSEWAIFTTAFLSLAAAITYDIFYYF
jgi:hypothetical protein